MITIKNDKNRPREVVFLNDGINVDGVAACDIRLRPDSIVVAVLDIFPEAIDIKANPLLSLETVERMAKHYGKKLVDGEYEFVVRSGDGWVCDSVIQEMTSDSQCAQRMSIDLATSVLRTLDIRGIDSKLEMA